MKEFTWQAYDGRRILICGPINMCLMILNEFPEDFADTVYFCDDNCAGKEYVEILAEIEKNTGSFGKDPAYEEFYSGYLKRLGNYRVTLLSSEELKDFSEDCCILCSRTFFRKYCKSLGYSGLEDFYSAVPILKSGYAKMTYFGYLTTLYRRQKEGLYLGGVEINLTKRCTLRCENCANLIQYYDNPERLDQKTVVDSVKNLLSAVDGIAMFKLLGGEPLLEQEMMKEILSLPELRPGGKVLGIQIITNGTILFREDVLKLMAGNPLLGVLMSNYGSLSFKEKELVKQLSEYGVDYSELPGNDRWRDFGDPHKVYHDPKGASDLYRRCRSKENCCTVLEGRFYACPRAAHGDMLSFYPEPEEYVDLLEQQDSVALKEKLRKFYHEYEALQVCARCTNLTGNMIDRAVQKHGKGVK